jgi:hypothetical protein
MHPTTIRVLTGLLAIGSLWVIFSGGISDMSNYRKAGMILITALFAAHAVLGESGSAWVFQHFFGIEPQVKKVERSSAGEASSDQLNQDHSKQSIT